MPPSLIHKNANDMISLEQKKIGLDLNITIITITTDRINSSINLMTSFRPFLEGFLDSTEGKGISERTSIISQLPIQ